MLPTSKPSSSPSAAPSDAPSIKWSKSCDVDDQGFRGCVTQSMVSSEPSSYPTSQPSPSPSALPSSSPSDVPTSIPSTHPTSQPSSSPSASPSGIPSIDYGVSCGAFISECFKNPKKNDGICKIASCCFNLKKGDIAGQRECVLNSAVPSSSPS
eukprot:scaffold12357_cov79-Skeletonema_marinoi.AAC.1